jgi:2-(1,2-epoxy-1,2-dihydrophenyl)acetyl-CoA isomerase
MIARTDPAVSAALVLETRQDAVTTLTLNRPERLNAIDAALGHALVDALQRAAQDPAVRCVVLTGAGRGFCSGGDLNLLRDARERHATGELESLLRSGKQIVLAIATMPKPVLAAVNGAAAGAGCNLALACAPRIASDRAIFVQSFARLGLFPDFGATYFLPRLLGSARAADLLYTGETISAADAARLGLVSRVVPHDTLAEEAAALAKSLAAAPPLVVRGIKQALFTDHREELQGALEEEIRWQIRCFQSKDSREGIQAYFEKRVPRFRGE